MNSRILKISRLGIGGIVDKEPSQNWVSSADFKNILDSCTSELEINYIDTAKGYLDAEEVIGIWLTEKGSHFRDKVVLGTKVGPKRKDGAMTQPLTSSYIQESLEESLLKLKTDYVDIYWMHIPDGVTPFEASMLGFSACIKSGKSRSTGLCNVSAKQIEEIVSICDEKGFSRPIAVQNSFSILTALQGRASAQKCHELGISFMAFSPLAGGILSGKYRHGQDLPADSRWGTWSTTRGLPEYWGENMFKKVGELELLAQKMGVSVSALSLAWCLQHPLVTTTLIGPRIPSHLGSVREAIQMQEQLSEIKPLNYEKILLNPI